MQKLSPASLTFLLVAFVSVTAPACGGDTNETPDLGTVVDLGPDLGEVDAGQDSGTPIEPMLFGPCNSAADCPGEGAICRANTNGWPGGFCTLPCTPPDRTPCFDGNIYHHCATQTDGSGSFCERRCQNGFDCQREAYTCVNVGGFDQTGGACIGICSSDEQCGGDAECNVWSGACTTDAPETGGIAGDACAGTSECRSGRCIAEMNGANPTGWVGGYCYGFCILPTGYTSSSLYFGDALPQGSCPSGDVCFPQNFAFAAEADPGICFHGCDSNADCREGYQCTLSWQLGGGRTATYTHGFCQPIDCSTAACPSGYTCRTVTTSQGTSYVCGH